MYPFGNTSSTYSVTFYHKDGGRQTPTHADGGSTVIQVQSMQSNYQVRQITEAPTNWTQQTFTFTTDAETTSVAILFDFLTCFFIISAHIINIIGKNINNISAKFSEFIIGRTKQSLACFHVNLWQLFEANIGKFLKKKKKHLRQKTFLGYVSS